VFAGISAQEEMPDPRPAGLRSCIIFRSMARTISVLFICFAIGSSVFAHAPRTKLTRDQQILIVEQRLADLGYWIVKIDGKADDSTRQAIIAFQKVEGVKRTGIVNDALIQRLNSASRPAARFRNGAMHVEIDISRQVLFVVDENGNVSRILPVSSGSERRYVEKGKRQIAHTPRGSFKIYRQIKGVRHAPLGTLYYPNYFTAGVAIHGSASVPATPASHGCVRIPRFAEREFSSMVSVGTGVHVYD